MRKEIVIRLQSSEKGHKKAIKVAAAVSGVESVTLAGEDKNLLLVIGFGVDSNDLTEKLRRKVGHAEVVELRTVDADELMRAAAANQYPYRYYPGAPPPPAPYYGNAGYPPPHQRGGGGGSGGGYYTPMTMATGGYYSGGGGGGYPQYGQSSSYPQYGQSSSYYPPAAAATTNTHTVVHHQYANNDPDSCAIM
ncbi:disease resistance protein RGA5-like [Oryza glaberrima]|uniref:disease resistance protein RGA5-like n=1 Tax=Oryza glaberrima TaxID=4538 RepID=UPI00023E2565|nr:disease resistance protein RGA5-like [Oryza glaberrima]